MLIADLKATETAEVAEGDAAVGVETVAADAVIDLGLGQGRSGFEASIESLQRCAAIESPVRSLLVVDGAKGIELELEVSPSIGLSHLLQCEPTMCDRSGCRFLE